MPAAMFQKLVASQKPEERRLFKQYIYANGDVQQSHMGVMGVHMFCSALCIYSAI